ncbi:hypothetical protein DV096_09915 [Bradymonadaceae bacterium TMQ3]|uniref:DUF2628 domain-containing protein n=1 Tax=Lujinxingia sediminis TaxID=2480984 RepID=A0ABY0CS88_9DELT|nr:hypothetical protein [Lujinxingia sediminis]RDV38121.1 hypothetical protein DV096_09915 [Bradymonadaceae bacterium TMQ3]RVU43678.1 hypothetical protein EA187_12705 [Lujinxingia sediminis]TXC75792.1 hypothetical protein FRC91_09820 [Bradymonadales bacterium TMQ1]
MLRHIAAFGFFLMMSLGGIVNAQTQEAPAPDAPPAEHEATVEHEANAGQDTTAERVAPPRSTFFDANHRQRIYEQGRLSHIRAALYTLLLPGLGNFYVEQYMLGTVAMSLTVFAGIFLAYGLSLSRNDLVGLGAGVAGLAYGGGLITSYQGVRRYNLQLQQSLQLDRASALAPGAPRTWGLSLSVTF